MSMISDRKPIIIPKDKIKPSNVVATEQWKALPVEERSAVWDKCKRISHE